MPVLVLKMKAACKPSPPFLQFFSRFPCGLLPFQKEMETNRTIFAISLSFFLHFCRRRRFWASVRLSRTISGAEAERRATDAGRSPSRARRLGRGAGRRTMRRRWCSSAPSALPRRSAACRAPSVGACVCDALRLRSLSGSAAPIRSASVAVVL